MISTLYLIPNNLAHYDVSYPGIIRIFIIFATHSCELYDYLLLIVATKSISNFMLVMPFDLTLLTMARGFFLIQSS